MKLDISIEETLEVLDQIVQDRGEDFVYDANINNLSCQYRPNPALGLPSCIVGEFFKRTSPEIYDLITNEENNLMGIHSLNGSYHLVSGDVEGVLYTAQGTQDIGINYGIVKDNYHQLAESILEGESK